MWCSLSGSSVQRNASASLQPAWYQKQVPDILSQYDIRRRLLKNARTLNDDEAFFGRRGRRRLLVGPTLMSPRAG
jgi:hypothetical protein